MTYLLLQTFLLLLSAYFLGAFLACLMKRMTLRRAELAAAVPRATLAPTATRVTVPAVAAKPRSMDLVQPKIDILPRPEPKAAPKQTALDTSRFDRALAIPDPNEGMPRKSIVEIRPAILKSPTGPAQPLKPKVVAPVAPVQAAPQPKPVTAAPVQTAPAPVKPAPVVVPAVATPAATPVAPSVQKTTSVPSTGSPQPASQSAGMAAATASAAAAAAVAAAQAAASAAVARPVAQAPAPAPTPAPVAKAPEPPRPATVVPTAPPAPAPSPVPVDAKPATAVPQPAPQPIAGGDDLLRIRAIDADTEKRLHGIGVRRFDDIARWTPADINRVNQALGLTGRIDREQWIEQAQILAKGGETYYSRNRAAAVRGDAPASALPQPASAPAPAQAVAQQRVAAATAAAAAAATPKQAAAQPQQPAASAPPVNAAPAAPQGRSVAEMASAAAAAIAAASASVTRGIRPIEPISPLSRANPNVSMPAKLSDAIKDKEKEVKAATPAVPAQTAAPVASKPKDAAPSPSARAKGDADDLKRIRGVGVLIEKRLNALDVHTYDDIANWTIADIDRISQQLDFKGRIERENWVEQARILSSGGHTEFSRRVDRGDVETSKDPEGA